MPPRANLSIRHELSPFRRGLSVTRKNKLKYIVLHNRPYNTYCKILSGSLRINFLVVSPSRSALATAVAVVRGGWAAAAAAAGWVATGRLEAALPCPALPFAGGGCGMVGVLLLLLTALFATGGASRRSRSSISSLALEEELVEQVCDYDDDACWDTGSDVRCEARKQMTRIGCKAFESMVFAGRSGSYCWEPMARQMGCSLSFSSSSNSSTTALPSWPRASVLSRSIAVDVSPGPAIWSHCESCAMVGGTVELFDPASAGASLDLLPPLITLAQTRWSPFFDDRPGRPAGRIEARTVRSSISSASCARWVETPTFVFHLLAVHAGHLMIDILGPLYNKISEHFGGELEGDVTLVLDVDRLDEELHLALLEQVYDSPDSFGLLRRLTVHPIHTLHSLVAWPGKTCFRHLYLGLDPSKDPSTAFQQDDPILRPDISRPEDLRRQQIYMRFGAFLRQQTDHLPHLITILRRTHASGRRVLNEGNLIAVAEDFCLKHRQGAPPCEVRAVFLEDLGLGEQLELFGRTRVLVSPLGSGLHNVPLMRPWQSIVILVPPGWCRFKSHIVNQALASGQHVLALCRGEQQGKGEGDWRLLAWHARSWRQGPWRTRGAYFSVRESQFLELVQHAFLDLPGTTPVTYWEEFSPDPIDFDQEHLAHSLGRGLAGQPSVKAMVGVIATPYHGNFPFSFQPEILVNFDPVSLMESDRMRYCASVSSSSPPNHLCMLHWQLSEWSGIVLGSFHSSTEIARVWVEVAEGGAGDDQGKVWREWPESASELQIAPAILELYARCQSSALPPAVCQATYDRGRLYQGWPTKEEPFIFLHLQKCGGTSVRRHLAITALKRQLPAFIPCWDDSGYNPHENLCYQFDLSRLAVEEREQLAIVGMHHRSGFDIWRELPSARRFHCFVMLRDPVDRAISLYYSRIMGPGDPPMNSLTVAELEDVMSSNVAAAVPKDIGPIYLDEGFEDAACKMLCSAKSLEGQPIEGHFQHEMISLPPPKPYTPEQATLRLSRCVVGILERWHETLDVLAAFFPWMLLDDWAENINRKKELMETRETLRPELVQVIERYNSCDRIVYGTALDMFEAQLAAAAAAA
jgi:hypothetical protein